MGMQELRGEYAVLSRSFTSVSAELQQNNGPHDDRHHESISHTVANQPATAGRH